MQTRALLIAAVLLASPAAEAAGAADATTPTRAQKLDGTQQRGQGAGGVGGWNRGAGQAGPGPGRGSCNGSMRRAGLRDATGRLARAAAAACAADRRPSSWSNEWSSAWVWSRASSSERPARLTFVPLTATKHRGELRCLSDVRHGYSDACGDRGHQDVRS